MAGCDCPARVIKPFPDEIRIEYGTLEAAKAEAARALAELRCGKYQAAFLVDYLPLDPCLASAISSGRYSKCMLSTWYHLAPQIKPRRSKISAITPGTRLRQANLPSLPLRFSQ